MVSHTTPPFHKLSFMVVLMNSLNPISWLRLCQGFFENKEIFFTHVLRSGMERLQLDIYYFVK